MKINNEAELKKSYKAIGDHNPVMTQRFGADPYALVYNDRVYLYMTGDSVMKNENGEIIENHYGNIYTINVISSADLVNWTDHGTIYAASEKGEASWGNNSWAPAAACKVIDGKPKFFLYFANNGNGIAVLTADDPAGPFTDPINGPLVSRETPTCAEVTWLFDPAVLVDDDGTGYLYFGGGVPSLDKSADPGTARVAKLADDMIHLDGDPVRIDGVSYLFEDSGINKINGAYYYSYCSNFDVPGDKVQELGFGCGEIITMKSDRPMGPFKTVGSVLKNPEHFFGKGGNNHHCMFEFKGQHYITYHSRILEEAMGINGGYRSTNIDVVDLDENGELIPATGTRVGVSQVKDMDMYERVPAVTMGVMAGVDTVQYGESAVKYGSGEMILTGMETGSFTGIYGVNFQDRKPVSFEAEVRSTAEAKEAGSIEVRIDSPDGETIASIDLASAVAEFTTLNTEVTSSVSGTHDIFFVFVGKGYQVRSWKFN